MRNLGSIQALRAVAANMVVASHICGALAGRYPGLVDPNALDFLGFSGVHCFFIISGFIMARAVNGADWRVFAVARVSRIYPIYWVYVLATIAFYIVWQIGFPAADRILPSLLLYPSNSQQIVPVAWSLVYEIYFYFIVTLIIASRTPLRSALITWALGVATLTTFHHESALLNVVASPLALEFIVGCFIAIVCTPRWAKTSLVAGIVMLTGGIVFYTFSRPSGLAIELTLLAAPFALIVYGLVGTEAGHKINFPRWTIALGDASYSTYLSHYMVIPVILLIALRLVPSLPWYVTAVICLGAANAWALVSFRYVERPLLNAVRSLSTGFGSMAARPLHTPRPTSVEL
jgi:peptidoglycan/LPS O-acetylase OafA/YrhL